MIFSNLPKAASEFMTWDWSHFEPYYRELADRALNADNAASWLADWTTLTNVVSEMFSRLSVDTSQNTADQDAHRTEEIQRLFQKRNGPQE